MKGCANSHSTGPAVWADISAALQGYEHTYTSIRLEGQQQIAHDQEATLMFDVCSTKPKLMPQLPWLNFTSFRVDNHVALLYGTTRCHDFLQHQEQLQATEVFIAQVPDSLSLEKVLKSALVAAEKLA